MDLTGDGKLDIVVIEDCNPSGPVGSSHWLVYPGDGTKFAATPTTFALPTGYSAGSFRVASSTGPTCNPGVNEPQYLLMDLTGDRKPDIVVIEDCNPSGPVGTSHWLVHANVCVAR
jgi:hypothetical protein